MRFIYNQKQKQGIVQKIMGAFTKRNKGNKSNQRLDSENICSKKKKKSQKRLRAKKVKTTGLGKKEN